MSSLDSTYRRLARAWSADELADRYHAAFDRGASDLPAEEEPPDGPITLLATAVPRLISLAVATNVLHILPGRPKAAAGLAGELIATIDTTATGSLHRGHLALQADGHSRGYDADDWLTLVYDQAADALEMASPSSEPPGLIEHAQQAGRFAALAIASLDADAPTVTEAICDYLGHLLFVWCSPTRPPTPKASRSRSLDASTSTSTSSAPAEPARPDRAAGDLRCRRDRVAGPQSLEHPPAEASVRAFVRRACRRNQGSQTAVQNPGFTYASRSVVGVGPADSDDRTNAFGAGGFGLPALPDRTESLDFVAALATKGK